AILSLPQIDKNIDSFDDFLHALENESYWWATRNYRNIYQNAKTSPSGRFKHLYVISNMTKIDPEPRESLYRNKSENFVLMSRHFGNIQYINLTRTDEKFIAEVDDFIADLFVSKYPVYHKAKENFPGFDLYIAAARGHHHIYLLKKL